MAQADFLIAPAALHVDADRELEARAILERFVKAASFEAKRIRWQTYEKLGPHSRMSFFVIIPQTEEAAAIAEVDRICAELVGRAGLAEGMLIDVTTEGVARHYEWVFSSDAASEKTSFFPGTHWFNIELGFYPPVQADLRKILHRED